MKTILVLTDLSNEASHAAEYSLNIATQVGAKLHFYHPFTLRQTNSLKYRWKLEEYFDLENDRRAKLQRLTEQLKEISRSSGFKPQITFTCRENQNDIVQNLREMVREKGVMMILISSDSDEFINSLFFDKRGNSIMGSTSCPVLFVPPYSSINKTSRTDKRTDNVIYPASYMHAYGKEAVL